MPLLLAALKYQFSDPALLARALTHRSHGAPHNERLEFLGDALLGVIIAEVLYARFPAADEGQLTRTRATLVNRDSLAQVAGELALGPRLLLGEGELKSGGWRRASILANTLEAIIGAIYLDGGFEACRGAVMQWFAARLASVDPTATAKDSKTRLQEFLQSRQLPLPVYQTSEVSGPPHDQSFIIACVVEGVTAPIQASGRSRREAEQEAARLALAALKVADPA